MRAAAEETWTTWFNENNLGVPYRIERLEAWVKEAILSKKIPKSLIENTSRLIRAHEVWNIAE